MEQRRLRLGDILDDYCPRERRVTNHAVVAMVEEDVKQTRCTTCDAEHVYKGGKTPRRKKSETGQLYKQVLAGLTDQEPVMLPAEPVMAGDQAEPDAEPIEAIADIVDDGSDDLDDEPQPTFIDDGPVHRPLIRAQLPRVEGVKLERQAPDFTIRQNNGRDNGRGNGHGAFRGAQPANNGQQRFGRGPQRNAGRGGQGFGRGPAGGNQPRQGGPRKRSR